jgi:hypothetical protein
MAYFSITSLFYHYDPSLIWFGRQCFTKTSAQGHSLDSDRTLVLNQPILIMDGCQIQTQIDHDLTLVVAANNSEPLFQDLQICRT